MKKNNITRLALYIIFSALAILAGNSFAANKNVTIIDADVSTKPIRTYADISNISYQLILTHIKIGNSRGGIDYLNLDIENNILNIMGTAEDLVRTDILQVLKISSNKTKILDNHLNKISKTINEGQFAIMLIQQEIDNQTRDMNNCINEKKVSDQAYFNSINYYDQRAMTTSLQISAVYNACISEARLRINAKTAVLNKLDFYHNLLYTKYSFLTDKRETILKNIDVIDQDLLQELNTINRTLEKYNF